MIIWNSIDRQGSSQPDPGKMTDCLVITWRVKKVKIEFLIVNTLSLAVHAENINFLIGLYTT